MVIQIAEKESGCDNQAINWKDGHKGCNGSFGALQVGCLHYKSGEDKKDLSLNIKIAYSLYEKRGGSFKDWSTCKTIKNCK